MLLWCPKNVFRLVGTIKCIIYLFKLKIYLYRCIYLFISNLSLFLSFSLAFFSPFLSVPAPTGFSGADRHLCWSLPAFLQTNCLHQPLGTLHEPSTTLLHPLPLRTSLCASLPSAHAGLQWDPHTGQSSAFLFHCEVQ